MRTLDGPVTNPRGGVDLVSRVVLLVYLVGIVLAHTGAGHIPAIAAASAVLVLAVATHRTLLSRQHLTYYVGLLLFAAVAAYHRPVDTVVAMIGMVMNILVYEQFRRIGLDGRHAAALLIAAAVLIVGYAAVTGSYDRLFFLNRNAVPPLALLLLFMSDHYLAKRPLGRAAVTVTALLSALLCRSRAGLLAVAGYLALRCLRRKSLQVAAFLAAAAVLTGAYLVRVLPLPDVAIMGRSIADLAGREQLWEIARQLVRRHPLGLGYQGYPTVFQEALGVELSPHSLYLAMLLQFGWFFFAVYCGLLSSLVASSRNGAVVAAVFAAHLRGFFESGLPFGFSLNSAILLLPFYMEHLPADASRRRSPVQVHEALRWGWRRRRADKGSQDRSIVSDGVDSDSRQGLPSSDADWGGVA